MPLQRLQTVTVSFKWKTEQKLSICIISLVSIKTFFFYGYQRDINISVSSSSLHLSGAVSAPADLTQGLASQFINPDLQRSERGADQRMGQASHLCASIWEIIVI